MSFLYIVYAILACAAYEVAKQAAVDKFLDGTSKTNPRSFWTQVGLWLSAMAWPAVLLLYAIVVVYGYEADAQLAKRKR